MSALQRTDRDKSFREKAWELVMIRAERSELATDPSGAVLSLLLFLTIVVSTGITLIDGVEADTVIGGTTMTIALLLGKYGIKIKKTMNQFGKGATVALF